MHTIPAQVGTLETSNALAWFKHSNFSFHTVNKYPFVAYVWLRFSHFCVLLVILWFKMIPNQWAEVLSSVTKCKKADVP